MIDRPARDRVIAAMEAYMNDEITAFAFDEALNDISSDDAAVNEATVFLWYFYDDLIDHPIHATKELWNVMYRIILFLQNDADLETEWLSRRSVTQGVAGGMLALLVLLALLAWKFGVAWPLLAGWVAGGVLAWVISRWFRAPLRKEPEEAEDEILFPFDSRKDIFHAARSIPGFRKKRFPPEFAQRRTRSRLHESCIELTAWLYWIPLICVLWLIFTPVILFHQMFPIQVERRSYRFPATLENGKTA